MAPVKSTGKLPLWGLLKAKSILLNCQQKVPGVGIEPTRAF